MNRDYFAVFLFNLAALISSCLMTLGRTSSIMLIRSDENKNPWFIPDLRGKAFSFHY